MFNRYLALGLITAITMITSPVFAENQTQGNSGTNNINATNVGKGNRIRVINRTYVIQSQRRAKKILCQSPNSTNQTQGNVTNNTITATNVGRRNRIKITNTNYIVQGQSVECPAQ